MGFVIVSAVLTVIITTATRPNLFFTLSAVMLAATLIDNLRPHTR